MKRILLPALPLLIVILSLFSMTPSHAGDDEVIGALEPFVVLKNIPKWAYDYIEGISEAVSPRSFFTYFRTTHFIISEYSPNDAHSLIQIELQVRISENDLLAGSRPHVIVGDIKLNGQSVFIDPFPSDNRLELPELQPNTKKAILLGIQKFLKSFQSLRGLENDPVFKARRATASRENQLTLTRTIRARTGSAHFNFGIFGLRNKDLFKNILGLNVESKVSLIFGDIAKSFLDAEKYDEWSTGLFSNIQETQLIQIGQNDVEFRDEFQRGQIVLKNLLKAQKLNDQSLLSKEVEIGEINSDLVATENEYDRILRRIENETTFEGQTSDSGTMTLDKGNERRLVSELGLLREALKRINALKLAAERELARYKYEVPEQLVKAVKKELATLKCGKLSRKWEP